MLVRLTKVCGVAEEVKVPILRLICQPSAESAAAAQEALVESVPSDDRGSDNEYSDAAARIIKDVSIQAIHTSNYTKDQGEVHSYNRIK